MKLRFAGSPRRTFILMASLAAFLLAGYLFHGMNYVRSVDAYLTENRMAFSPRRASGGIAFLAIDKKSLDTIGVWPWPRSIHGQIVDELMKSGVRDIAFDIDFSARSDPAQDEAFAAALKRAGGAVILPAFLQSSAAERSRQQLSLTSPIPELADNAWLGAVNVIPGMDGVVRDMPYAVPAPDGPLASIPTLLAGNEGNRLEHFPIDFSINPATVPVYSVSTLLAGKLSKGALDGKSVLVGAHAVELKDYFTVPVHGNIPGPMVQILAAETLLQNRVAVPANPWLAGLALSVALAGFFFFKPRRLTGQFLFLAATGLAFEGVAFYLYRDHAIALHTALIHLALVGIAFSRTVIELDIRGWLLKMAAIETRNTRQILEQVINDNSDAILVADEDGLLIEISERVYSVFRPGRQVGLGAPMAQVLPERLQAEAQSIFERVRSGEVVMPAVREIVLPGDGGSRCIEYSITPSRLERPEGVAFVICVAARDITERRRQQEALDRLSRFDQLTGALRETEFVTRLDKLLAEQPAESASAPVITVYSLNLHRFKTINTTLGRDVGDSLLTLVARTLETYDPGVLLVGRTGGDSFCLARRGSRDFDDPAKFAESLIRTLGIPFLIGEHRAKIGVHIGFALWEPTSGTDAATLLDNAEFALDEARAINGSGWTRFDPAASDRITRWREMERELWRALERNEISVTYQPQVALKDRRLIGVEALVRWNHPQLGQISPGDFVQIAEANGFVEKLGQWVLWRACDDAMSWAEPITVAVNVSPLQFTRGDVVSDVAQALAQSNLPPDRLQLEITESTFLDQSGDLVRKLNDLKALGVTLALDDFGTGYSSFGYLAKFPLDKLKLDQMFVRNLTDSASSQAIIRSVRSLCEGLSITMICEGVETEAQRAFLAEIGCEQGQGYLFGRPQDNDAIRDMIGSGRL